MMLLLTDNQISPNSAGSSGKYALWCLTK